ncbi:Bug family tripartite tricarboxylate transporter substrate binding protein [Ramlibacter sp.]|uniref:Bug family tripartite tricarboxylate transporter substrate binding protein n=1 Tax=Ramlibacter sp. TaxID=1917967 RepID=UPI003D09ADCE
MNSSRRLFTASLLAAPFARAWAQGYPEQPIKMIVGFPPGGPTDSIGRYLGKEMSATLGQNILIDNRPGATGLIGLEALANSKPDGYTVLLMPNVTTVALLATDKPLDIDKRFTAIGGTIVQPTVIVVNPKTMDVKNMAELIAYYKANPGAPYTSSGHGSPSHIVMTVFAKRRGLNVTHVAHKGIQPALLDVMAGRIGMIITDASQAGVHAKSGALRVIASGGSVRSTMFPDIPTVAEQGIEDFEYEGANGLVAPVGTPAAVIQKLADALKKAVESEGYVKMSLQGGNKAVFSDGRTFRDALEKDFNRWARLKREAGELK